MLSTFRHDIGAHTLTVEAGKLAQQANGSVLLRYGESVLLITATMGKPREGIDFFPLTIDFEERLYARGKIPGGFFRREGRPSTDAVLIDRLTDRPIRPLFPKGLRNEVQVIITPLSADLENPLDILTILGASMALSVSDIPFEGPLSATRIGFLDDEYVINPTFAQLERSKLDLVVAGTRAGVLMMEAGVSELSESQVLEAIRRAQDVNLGLLDFQEQIIQAIGKEKSDYTAESLPAGLESRMSSALDGRLIAAMDEAGGKADRASRTDDLKTELVESLSGEFEPSDVSTAFDAALEAEVRRRILVLGQRPDGRGVDELRPISCEVGILPRTHGTGLFNRGETQVLGIATLGSVGDAQKIDNINPVESKRFLLHYNFPPYSVGEARRVGSPGRREIGHGALAERAVVPVLPSEEEFPYTIRIVAEILSSNGSTSMGSVCATSLALMDAGVPIKAPVAGISIGLVTDDSGEFVTITDIQGMEDHIGDMDFKVAGTEQGITAIQLDIKIKSIGFDIIEAALKQAREARLIILQRMSETISEPRTEMSPHAPKMLQIKIPVAKIGMVIGPGGKTIRAIVEETKATVDVQDDGTIIVGSPNQSAAAKAVAMIEDLTREVKVGEIYTGKVVRIMSFGAFVQLLPGKDGLVHISELAEEHVPSVEDVVDIGEEITVIVKEIDAMGRVNLSRRALLEGASGEEAEGGEGRTSDPQTGPDGPRTGAGPPPQGQPSGRGYGPPRGRPSGGGSGPRNRGPSRPQGPPRRGGYRDRPRPEDPRPPG